MPLVNTDAKLLFDNDDRYLRFRFGVLTFI